jgi:tetratricopeptide (TPR) repeat protein
MQRFSSYKRIVFIIGMLILFDCAFSQQNKIESLKEEIKNNLLLNPNKARVLAEQLRDIAIESDNLYEKANALFKISQAYRIQSQYQKAIDQLFMAKNIFEELDKQVNIGNVQNEIGVLYKLQGEYERSVEYHLKAKGIAIEYNSQLLLSTSLKELGVSFFYLKDYEKSKFHYESALEIAIMLEEHALIAILYNNVGVLKSKIAENITDRTTNLEILTYYQKALLADEQMESKELEAAIYDNIGDVYVKLAEYDKASLYLDKGLTIAKEINAVNRIIESHDSFYNFYNVMSDDKNALLHLQKYISLKNSFTQQKTTNELTELKYKYEDQQRKYEFEMLKEKEKFGTLLLTSLGVVCVLLLTSLIFGWRTLRIRLLKNKEILQIQTKEQANQDKLIEANLEKQQLEKKNLEQEIELQNQQKSAYGLHIIQKQQLLTEIQTMAKDMLNKPTSTQVKKILNIIQAGMHTAEELKLVSNALETENVHFFDSLKADYPELTNKELKMCLLGKLDLDTKTVASFLNIAPNSVSVARHRIRKKLHLAHEESLNNFLQNING